MVFRRISAPCIFRGIVGFLLSDLLKGKIIDYVFSSFIFIFHFKKYFSVWVRIFFIFLIIAFDSCVCCVTRWGPLVPEYCKTPILKNISNVQVIFFRCGGLYFEVPVLFYCKLCVFYIKLVNIMKINSFMRQMGNVQLSLKQHFIFQLRI